MTSSFTRMGLWQEDVAASVVPSHLVRSITSFSLPLLRMDLLAEPQFSVPSLDLLSGRKSHQDPGVRLIMDDKSRPERATKTVRFVSDKGVPERATKTREYDLLRIRVGQKEPPRPGSTICSDKGGPERATKTREYDLLRIRVGQKEPPRPGSTICYG